MEKDVVKKLYRYSYLKFKIDSVNEELEDLASLIATQRSVKTQNLTGMPGSNQISDPVGQAAERIIDVYCHECERLQQELSNWFDEKAGIEKALEPLNDLERTIIELKYFKKYKWWMVASAVNYSEKQCRRINNKALDKIKYLIL